MYYQGLEEQRDKETDDDDEEEEEEGMEMTAHWSREAVREHEIRRITGGSEGQG